MWKQVLETPLKEMQEIIDKRFGAMVAILKNMNDNLNKIVILLEKIEENSRKSDT